MKDAELKPLSVRQVLVALVLEGLSVEEIKKKLPKMVDVSKLKVSISFYITRVKGDLKKEGRLAKSFVVQSKDVFDKAKNPKLSLSPKDILKNKKIKKTPVKTHQQEIKEAKKVLSGVRKRVKVVCCKCKRSYSVRTNKVELYTEAVRKNYLCMVCKK